MKNYYIITILLCLIFASCGEDRRKEYAERTAPDRWIESVMRENYYWYEDMPDSKKLNFFTEPATFFSKLLSNKDANYSYFEDPADTESLKSYGIEFESMLYNDTAYAIQVLYVDSDSPAKESGLERGDWIIKRNSEYIIRNRIDSLYRGNAITITLGEYEPGFDENETPIHTFKDKGILELGAARVTADNPIHFGDVLPSPNGKKVGYLVYSHFTPGRSDSDKTYDDQLRAISNTFKSENPEEFILDLRYNTGGTLESAQLLGSILVPQEALENTMCYIEYNDKQSSRDEIRLFSNEILGSGSNLNLNRLYIITGSTTASTSDVLINTLKPYIDEILLVGQPTKGNYTGTHAYSDNQYPYTLHPVDCMIYNANDHLPTGGHTPGNLLDELQYMDIFPIGNTNEILLYATLYLIDNGSMPDLSRTRSAQTKKAPGFCTLKKAQNHGTSIR